MKKKQWSENEVAILDQYSNSSKSAYQLYQNHLDLGSQVGTQQVMKKLLGT